MAGADDFYNPMLRAEFMGDGDRVVYLHGRGLCDATDADRLEAVWRFRRNYEAANTGAR